MLWVATLQCSDNTVLLAFAFAGVPAEQVHRLLLGLSPSGTDMRPWLEVAGSCVPALQRAAGELQCWGCDPCFSYVSQATPGMLPRGFDAVQRVPDTLLSWYAPAALHCRQCAVQHTVMLA